MLPILSVSSAITLLLLQAAPSSLDVRLLEKYSNAWTDSEAGSPLEDQARADFGGRGGVRDLPPPPLQLLSVAALAFFSAGTATGAAALIPRRGRNVSSTIIRVVLTLITAAWVAGVICAATRAARLFPSDLGGWELIFDPLGAAILAAAIAAILVALDRILPWRRTV